MGWLGLAGLPDCAHGRALFSWYVLLLMALYVPAGWVVSRLRGWPRPDRKTGCKAVLYPALCAWGWAFGGCGLLLLFSGREALFPLAFTGFALLALSFLLASPSALFMLLTLDLLSGSLRDAGVNAFFQSSAWFAAMFLAGLLPPMLFFLGSLLPKKRLTTAKNVIKSFSYHKKRDDEAKQATPRRARGDGESPPRHGPARHFRAARDDRDAPSPLPDD